MVELRDVPSTDVDPVAHAREIAEAIFALATKSGGLDG
jgi:hypothetical protein